MKSKLFFSSIIILSMALLLILASCSKDEKEDKPVKKDKYTQEILQERAYKDSIMHYDPYSPFNRDPKAIYAPLKYYDPNPEFVFKSKFHKYEKTDTVEVSGTRGEIRKVIREGYLNLNYKGKTYKINVYKGFSQTGDPYYSIWFTDKTTGEETYGVGRYLEFSLNPDSNHVYTIDFNKAYNPYCAYSSEYTCPIPREEDYLDFAIRAGEKNFHTHDKN